MSLFDMFNSYIARQKKEDMLRSISSFLAIMRGDLIYIFDDVSIPTDCVHRRVSVCSCCVLSLKVFDPLILTKENPQKASNLP